MTVTRILSGLEACDARGDEADAIARLGFLEWVFSAREAVTAIDALGALKSRAAQEPQSDAARAFVGYLRDATQAPTNRRNRRSRTRVLH